MTPIWPWIATTTLSMLSGLASAANMVGRVLICTLGVSTIDTARPISNTSAANACPGETGIGGLRRHGDLHHHHPIAEQCGIAHHRGEEQAGDDEQAGQVDQPAVPA
jgi:hypothetical protein